MKDNEVYQLDIWKGDWGLPSVDVNCLQILTYARFAEIPLQIKATNNPFKTPNGKLPVLRTSTETMDSRGIINFFRSKNHSLDFGLSPRQCTETLAYETMLQEQLHPAMQFIWWIDPVNFNDLVRQWYAKALPFPLNYYYPGRFEGEAKKLMESLYPMDYDNLSTLETEVYSKAQKCITLLSTRLGESKFFFGSNPSTLDAIVYSFLAPILKTPLPHNALQNHLHGCTNLVKFVTQISQKYFESYHMEFEKQNVQKVRSPDEESDFPNKRRDQVIAGLFVTAAMMGYALSTGVVEVWSKDDADDSVYMEDEDEDNED